MSMQVGQEVGGMAASGGVMSGDPEGEDSADQGEAVRASIDHTDEIGPVTVTINDADHSEPLPTIIDELQGEEVNCGSSCTLIWSC